MIQFAEHIFQMSGSTTQRFVEIPFERHLDQVCWIPICVGSQEMSLDSNKKMFVLRGLAAQRFASLQSKISHPSWQLLSWWFSFYPLVGSGASSGFLVGGERSTYAFLFDDFYTQASNYIKNPVLKPNFHCFMLHVFFFAACYGCDVCSCLSCYCSHLGPQNSFACHGAVCAAFLFSRGGGGCFSGSKDLRQKRRWVEGCRNVIRWPFSLTNDTWATIVIRISGIN